MIELSVFIERTKIPRVSPFSSISLSVSSLSLRARSLLLKHKGTLTLGTVGRRPGRAGSAGGWAGGGKGARLPGVAAARACGGLGSRRPGPAAAWARGGAQARAMARRRAPLLHLPQVTPLPHQPLELVRLLPCSLPPLPCLSASQQIRSESMCLLLGSHVG